ncbi:MAG: 2-amino-4-hydroxy-6-hydroxymethyldihydropteridine diphosphokinase [Gammaproteobacteria bacterium]|nr:2-amino-4-hydroxy-6-hydroxymethyldihydropteridine diphosphokinase [Gammaproteobacteria bacterium]
MEIAYIGLGSNLEQPYLQIKNAITALDALTSNKVLADSGYFKSKPMGPDDQPGYVNAVVKLETTVSAIALLKQCQSIEKQQGRIKKRHWGERTIDLDILLYAQVQMTTDNLKLPHPGICQRDFVFMPLLKISPDIVVPGKGVLDNIVKTHVETSAENNKDWHYSCQFAGDIDR